MEGFCEHGYEHSGFINCREKQHSDTQERTNMV